MEIALISETSVAANGHDDGLRNARQNVESRKKVVLQSSSAMITMVAAKMIMVSGLLLLSLVSIIVVEQRHYALFVGVDNDEDSRQVEEESDVFDVVVQLRKLDDPGKVA